MRDIASRAWSCFDSRIFSQCFVLATHRCVCLQLAVGANCSRNMLQHSVCVTHRIHPLSLPLWQVTVYAHTRRALSGDAVISRARSRECTLLRLWSNNSIMYPVHHYFTLPYTPFSCFVGLCGGLVTPCRRLLYNTVHSIDDRCCVAVECQFSMPCDAIELLRRFAVVPVGL